jgi:hypothetical protein
MPEIWYDMEFCVNPETLTQTQTRIERVSVDGKSILKEAFTNVLLAITFTNMLGNF